MVEHLKDFYENILAFDLIYVIITLISLIKCSRKGFVLSILAEPILENLKEKGRISFFFGLPSHEAYQFKGQFLETREITEEELAKRKEEDVNCLLLWFYIFVVYWGAGIYSIYRTYISRFFQLQFF